MTELYMLNGISKQGHLNAVKFEKEQQERIPIYINIIIEAREIHPTMGLRTIYETYQPEGIGRDSFIDLGRAAGFLLEQYISKTRTTFSIKSSRYKNLLCGKWFTDVNQLWTSDITYFFIREKAYYLIFIMDVYSRRIIGYKASDNMRAENNIKALNQALTLRGNKKYSKDLIHHSDKGSQYISNDYTNLLEEYEIAISMCNEVYENSHIERVNGIIKNDYLIHRRIDNYRHLCKELDRAVDTYNNLRPHSALNKMTPVNYEAYLLSIPLEKRTILEVFIGSKSLKQNDSNPNQILMNFGL